MRAHPLLLAILAFGAGSLPAAAQPLTRADATGLVGWYNANKSEFSSYNDWYNRSGYAGAMVGWHWTEHLKTEVDAGVTSETALHATSSFEIAGQRAYGSSEHRFSTRRMTASQHYQFLHNAWTHPHVAAGVDLTWETHEQRDEPIVLVDPVSHTSRIIQPAARNGPSTALKLRPFAEVGLKRYVTRRTFLRTDARMTFGRGVDEVLVRAGFGVDF